MKNAKLMGVVVVVVVMLLGAYRQGRLVADDAVSPPKIGIINVTEVLENCQAHKQWQEKMKAEQATVRQELDTLKNELDSLQANLKLRSPGSEDYLKLAEELNQKKAVYDAKQQFNPTKVEEQMREWTGVLYQRVMKVTEDLAKKKGLDMVMSTETLDTDSLSMRDFMLALRTKKLLYFNTKYDLTAEALAAMDAMDAANSK